MHSLVLVNSRETESEESPKGILGLQLVEGWLKAAFLFPPDLSKPEAKIPTGIGKSRLINADEDLVDTMHSDLPQKTLLPMPNVLPTQGFEGRNGWHKVDYLQLLGNPSVPLCQEESSAASFCLNQREFLLGNACSNCVTF